MDVIVELSLVQGERSSIRWHHPVSLRVPRGEAHLVRAHSSFSAPLFRLCLGFSEPVTGSLKVQGHEPWRLGRDEVRAFRRTIGTTLDPDGLVANLNLRMNLVVPLVYASGLHYEEAVERANEVMSIMHLTMWSEARPASLPAEIRQTAALARALCPRPSLLLLENPLASVDHKETRRLLSLCRSEVETLLIASHRRDGVIREFTESVWEWDDEGFRVAA